MKTTIIHHSADFDGLFCREIARKFLPDTEVIGWDFADQPLKVPEGRIYILDLPVDRVFGFDYQVVRNQRGPQQPGGLIWIDHHKSSIESHPADIEGYRIDGVAACRLAWQWFTINSVPQDEGLPRKEKFVEREVSEPWAVRLAGEYDIWDKRDPDAELFQHGLRSMELGENMWDLLLTPPTAEDGEKQGIGEIAVQALLDAGKAIQYAKTQENAAIIARQGFDLKFEGLNFLACNHAMFNSHLFTAGVKPEHDALLGFRYDGKRYHVSLYHKPGREDLDLSLIATKHGGGGHRGACGFSLESLNDLLSAMQ